MVDILFLFPILGLNFSPLSRIETEDFSKMPFYQAEETPFCSHFLSVEICFFSNPPLIQYIMLTDFQILNPSSFSSKKKSPLGYDALYFLYIDGFSLLIFIGFLHLFMTDV